MLLGQEPLILRREGRVESIRTGGQEDEAQQTWAHLGEEGPPGTRRPLLVAARSLDDLALPFCTQHLAGPAAPLGWDRNILLYKMGSLTTFGTFKQLFSF